MKVIYIPIRIPLNNRSLAAAVLTLLATFLCCISTATDSWQTVLAKELTVDMTEAGNYTYEDITTVHIGLERVLFQTCHEHQVHDWELCSVQHIVFSNCNIEKPKQGYAYNSYLQQTFCGAPQWSESVAAFSLCVIACIVGALAIVLVFLRERWIGAVALLCALCLLAAVVLQTKAASATLVTVNQIGDRIKTWGGTYESGLGYSYFVACLSVSIFFAAGVTSLSLIFCEPEHSEDPEATSNKPPAAVAVEMSAAAAVTAQGMDSLAAGAAQPGFVHLESGPSAGDGGDDDDINEPVAVVHPSNRSTGSDAEQLNRRSNDAAGASTGTGGRGGNSHDAATVDVYADRQRTSNASATATLPPSALRRNEQQSTAESSGPPTVVSAAAAPTVVAAAAPPASSDAGGEEEESTA